MNMLDNYKVLTITHHNLNVDEIGNFVVHYENKDHLKSKLSELKEKAKLEELIYLSTCNRVSFICYSNEEFDLDYVKNFFSYVNPELQSDKLKKISKFVDVYHGSKAVNHIYEVASSMDSLVVGEREIFRQFRESYQQSLEFGLVADNLRMLENSTVKAAKEVYDKTRIGEKPLSIVSLAVKSLMDTGIDRDARLLLVGAGETNTLFAKFLKKYEFSNVSIFNRSLDNASHLVDLLGAKAYHLSELNTYNKGFDAMIVCTAATSSIIDSQMYRNLLQKEKDTKVVIDLSVPNNVDASVVDGFDINYIDIEQLRHLSTENLEFRKTEVHAARGLLKAQLMNFNNYFQQRQLEKALNVVPKEIKEIKERAIQQVYKKQIEALDENAQALIAEMMNYMEKKCISVPMKVAKKLVE
ncbi:MAG: glutamyl-tRNA reductase [Saprospiraceae bacterium]|nr:glutamyl-tRNA reductase [Saprospiraceae bacterium]